MYSRQIGLQSVDDLQTVAVYARDRVNPLMFNYALSVAILHRPDTKDLSLPLMVETFPEKFVDSKVFREIREEAAVAPAGMRIPIIIPKGKIKSQIKNPFVCSTTTIFCILTFSRFMFSKRLHCIRP